MRSLATPNAQFLASIAGFWVGRQERRRRKLGHIRGGQDGAIRSDAGDTQAGLLRGQDGGTDRCAGGGQAASQCFTSPDSAANPAGVIVTNIPSSLSIETHPSFSICI